MQTSTFQLPPEWERRAPRLVLAAALVGASVLLIALTWGLTFYQDTWAFLMHRRGFNAEAFLKPHNEHIVVIPVAIEKILIAVFGMTTAAPEFILLIVGLGATAYLLYLYVRRRLGEWPAVMAAVLLLFVGPAWQVLLWPFEIGFVGSVLAGIAMLLALEREDKLGDRLACLALAVSLGFSSLGLSFVCAAAVEAFQKRKTRGWRHAYVVAAPFALYLVWYAGWGHTAESHLSLKNALNSPVYLLNGLASSLDTVLGLSTIPVTGIGQPEWGRPLLVAAAVAFGVWQWRRPGIPARFWPVAAATASFWLLAGFNFIPGREATSSRYAYAGVAFVLLLAADLLQGVSLRRRGLLVCGVVVALAAASNMPILKEGQETYKQQTVLTKADTGAIDIAAATVAPEFALTPEIAGTLSLVDVDAGEYLPAVEDHGSPGYSPEELEDAPVEGRRQADIVLAKALPVSTVQDEGADAPAGANCTTVEAEPPNGQGVELARGKTYVEIGPGGSATLSLRRFASEEFPAQVGPAEGGSTVMLTIPGDRAPEPWFLHVEAPQQARVCSG